MRLDHLRKVAVHADGGHVAVLRIVVVEVVDSGRELGYTEFGIFGLKSGEIHAVEQEFVDFLGFVLRYFFKDFSHLGGDEGIVFRHGAGFERFVISVHIFEFNINNRGYFQGCHFAARGQK